VRVGAARHSVAEAHRAEHVGANLYGNNESRTASKTSMEIRDAAARGRTRMAFRQNVRTNQGTSSAYDLRDRTLQVRATDDVDPLERAHESITVWLGVCRCDARDGPPRDDKHHTEISQSWNGLPDDVSDCSSCASRSGSRDRSS